MAVALLERKVDTVSEERVTSFRDSYMTADEKHNSAISSIYAKLINPENSIRDILGKEQNIEEEQNAEYKEDFAEEQYETSVAADPVYRVDNARANSDIFRADSIVNKKVIDIPVASEQTDEDEDEDLRPTPTTIQYKTTGEAKVSEEGKIQTKTISKKAGLTKNDKIIIAVAVAVIVALFVLIIVNSAIITNLNSEVSVLRISLAQTESTYAEVLAQKNAYLEDKNLFEVVSTFATNNGMVQR